MNQTQIILGTAGALFLACFGFITGSMEAVVAAMLCVIVGLGFVVFLPSEGENNNVTVDEVEDASKNTMLKLSNAVLIVDKSHALYILNDRFKSYLAMGDVDNILNLESIFVKEIEAFDYYMAIRHDVTPKASERFLTNLGIAIQEKLDQLASDADAQLDLVTSTLTNANPTLT